MTELPQNATDALKLMAKVQFRPFDDMDWSAWAGCESAEPMIGQIDDITVIIDGDCITFNQYHADNGLAEWYNYILRFDSYC